jgi:hypothetical protein
MDLGGSWGMGGSPGRGGANGKFNFIKNYSLPSVAFCNVGHIVFSNRHINPNITYFNIFSRHIHDRNISTSRSSHLLLT